MFVPGDRVLIRNHNPSHPFEAAWLGPYLIVRRRSATMYEIDRNGRQFRYHVDQLRPAPEGNRQPNETSSEEEDEEIPYQDDSTGESESEEEKRSEIDAEPAEPVAAMFIVEQGPLTRNGKKQNGRKERSTSWKTCLPTPGGGDGRTSSELSWKTYLPTPGQGRRVINADQTRKGPSWKTVIPTPGGGPRRHRGVTWMVAARGENLILRKEDHTFQSRPYGRSRCNPQHLHPVRECKEKT